MEEELVYQFNLRLREMNEKIDGMILKNMELENEIHFLNKKVKKLEEERDDGR